MENRSERSNDTIKKFFGYTFLLLGVAGMAYGLSSLWESGAFAEILTIPSDGFDIENIALGNVFMTSLITVPSANVFALGLYLTRSKPKSE